MAELLTKNIKLKQKFRFRSNTILHCVVFEVDPRPGFEGWLSARVRHCGSGTRFHASLFEIRTFSGGTPSSSKAWQQGGYSVLL